jgi:hypothetical protein
MNMEGFRVLQSLARYQKGKTAADNHGIRYKEHGKNGCPTGYPDHY